MGWSKLRATCVLMFLLYGGLYHVVLRRFVHCELVVLFRCCCHLVVPSKVSTEIAAFKCVSTEELFVT